LSDGRSDGKESKEFKGSDNSNKDPKSDRKPGGDLALIDATAASSNGVHSKDSGEDELPPHAPMCQCKDCKEGKGGNAIKMELSGGEADSACGKPGSVSGDDMAVDLPCQV